MGCNFQYRAVLCGNKRLGYPMSCKLQALLWARAVGLAVLVSCAAVAGAGCTGPLDCNAQECGDCACDNSQCACADGWLGAHCETPFCTNRTAGCSGHGNCRQTLHNISCACDDGFIGAHCETATCALKCEHGGTPNAACNKCDGCLGAWGGKLCDTWDGSVPIATLMSKLYAITNATQKMLDAQAQFNPVCKQDYECVGWGVDAVTGAPLKRLTPRTTA